jgi:hypothetical protein
MNDRPAIKEIRRRLVGLENKPGMCLHVAHHTADVLSRYGYQVVIQAGSLQWPRIQRHEDDGVMSTHYSYMWSPETPESHLSVALGCLPEMHVWVGILDTQEIVDFSTRWLKQAAEGMGLAWTADEPPEFLWCSAKKMPDWVVYTPVREATIYACKIFTCMCLVWR